MKEIVFNDEQKKLIKTQICPGASDEELLFFISQCKRTGLDPFSRQIFGIKRWNSREKKEVLTIQISIDGFRVIAERSHEYRGQTVPEFCDTSGQWKSVWNEIVPPYAAKVGVHRKDFVEPLYSVVLWKDYVQKDDKGEPAFLWAKFPTIMISKCAEAQALRKAFPNDLSGLYITDEMSAEQAIPEKEVEPPKQIEKPEPESKALKKLKADLSTTDAKGMQAIREGWDRAKDKITAGVYSEGKALILKKNKEFK